MAETAMRVGFAKRDITPEIGRPMAGYSARLGNSEGTHDPLYVRALTLHNESEGSRLAFLVADLVAFDPATLAEFRRRVAAETGLNADDVIVAVSHTHSGPAYGAFYGSYTVPLGEAEPDRSVAWGRNLPNELIGALREAVAGEVPVEVAVTRTQVRIGTHRRLIDPLGVVRLTPNPAGPTDPEVSILQARDPRDGRVVATLINHACHPVVLCEDNLQFSGDFPAFAIREIETATGAPALFLNGTCGNINPVRRGDFEAAAALGTELATSALAAASGASEWQGNLPLRSAGRTVALPLEHPTLAAFDAYVAAAEQALAAHRDPENYEGRRLADEVARAQEMRNRIEKRRIRVQGMTDAAGNLPFRLQVATIGPAAVVAMPGETFMELGLELRQGTGAPVTFVVGYSNEAISYVPTREAYPEGGYEVDVAQVAAGAGEKLVQEALALLGSTRAAAVPDVAGGVAAGGVA